MKLSEGCYVMDPVKAVEMVFVGYESGSKGYCLWNPKTRSIVVSGDVTFNESIFPARVTVSFVTWP